MSPPAGPSESVSASSAERSADHQTAGDWAMAPLIAGVVSVEAVRAARRAERPPKLCPTRTMWLLLMIGGSSVASALANVWEVYSSLRSLAALSRKTRLIWG